jgi:hypothetical protein
MSSWLVISPVMRRDAPIVVIVLARKKVTVCLVTVALLPSREDDALSVGSEQRFLQGLSRPGWPTALSGKADKKRTYEGYGPRRLGCAE